MSSGPVRMLAIVAALCEIAAAAVLVVTVATADDHRYSAEIRRGMLPETLAAGLRALTPASETAGPA